MNTMKKWVLAGLIGLFSAAASMATTYLDLNTIDSDAQWNPSHISVAAGGQWQDVYSTGDGVTKTSHRSGSITSTYTDGHPMSGYGDINGSAMELSFTRDAVAGTTPTSTKVTLLYSYVMPAAGLNDPLGEFSGLNMANWQGVVIDFANFADTDLARDGVDLILAINTLTGDGYYTINLDNHIAGTIGSTFAWSDFGVPVGFNPVTDLGDIELSYAVDTTLARNIGFTFTETINSFKLYGPDQQGVPEPETVWMMLAVLASLGVTFRRQLMDLAGRFVKT